MAVVPLIGALETITKNLSKKSGRTGNQMNQDNPINSSTKKKQLEY